MRGFITGKVDTFLIRDSDKLCSINPPPYMEENTVYLSENLIYAKNLYVSGFFFCQTLNLAQKFQISINIALMIEIDVIVIAS